jgi:glycosyltransferase involved in cell wall biosynthesis
LEGGEERSLALQQRALANAGVEHRLLERRSEDTGRVQAARALLRGGADEDEVARAARELQADVVHVHNMQPLFGPRGLAAARSAGARVILHLHNARLFCAIGVAARDGAPCYRCHGRNTLPGLVLNCRGSLPEAAAYATGLALHQPLALSSADRFVAPSRWAAGQLARLGVPADKLDVLTHYLPADEISADSRAHQGRYVLSAGRLAPEKGFDLAIAAAARASVPLWIAGDGPDRQGLESQAKALNAPVEFLGAVPREQMPDLLRGAAGLLLSSRSHEFSPFSVLEAMGAGLPVIATRSGGVPGLIGRDRCVRLGDGVALAARLSDLWSDPDGRRSEGERLLTRVRGQHSERRYLRDLMAIYGSSRRTPAQ